MANFKQDLDAFIDKRIDDLNYGFRNSKDDDYLDTLSEPIRNFIYELAGRATTESYRAGLLDGLKLALTL